MQIITVGRGHSGTRIMSHTLAQSGIYVGNVNSSGDLMPPHAMYAAVRLFGVLVKGTSGNWDFSEAMETSPLLEYERLVNTYLKPFRIYDTYAWKLPETVLALPWLVRMFPDAYYIHWVRDGRDNILGYHGTEDDWYGVGIDLPEDRLTRAAMSWDYHEELIAQTPKPKHWLKVRYEDFVLSQDMELKYLTQFLKTPLAAIPVQNTSISRYLGHEVQHVMPIMNKHLWAHGYIEETVHAD